MYTHIHMYLRVYILTELQRMQCAFVAIICCHSKLLSTALSPLSCSCWYLCRRICGQLLLFIWTCCFVCWLSLLLLLLWLFCRACRQIATCVVVMSSWLVAARCVANVANISPIRAYAHTHTHTYIQKHFSVYIQRAFIVMLVPHNQMPREIIEQFHFTLLSNWRFANVYTLFRSSAPLHLRAMLLVSSCLLAALRPVFVLVSMSSALLFLL